MAIIYSYPQNVNILSTDILVGTSTVIVNGKPKNQTKSFSISELTSYISTSLYPYISNNFVPLTRTITIDGVTQDLGANRVWTTIGSGITLDGVLNNGNTSLLDANIGSLGIWDNQNAGYATISVQDNGFELKNMSADNILRVEQSVLSLYQTNGVTGNLIVSNITASRNYEFPNQSGTIALTSDIPTLNQVLNAGNTSLLNAKIGELYLYDVTNFDYAKIKINDSEYNLHDSGGTIITTLTSSGVAFSPNTYNGFLYVPNTITTSRIYEFPNKSGIVALTSDIPASKILFKSSSSTYQTVSGTVTVISPAILSSTFTDGDLLKIQSITTLVSPSVNLTTISYFINSTPSLVGATQLAIYDGPISNRYMWTDRSFWTIGGTFKSRNFGNSSSTSQSNSGSALGSVTIPGTFYILATVTTTGADLACISSIIVEKI